MKLLLQVSAVLSAIALSFFTAPVGATTYSFDSFAPLDFAVPGVAGELGIPTKWGQEPNSATNLNTSPASFGTPGSATWSVMGPGLNDIFGGLKEDLHIGMTTDFTALTAGDEITMINQALGLWDSVSGFTSLGQVADGGGGFGAAGGQLGDIRIGTMAIDLPGLTLGHSFQPGTEALFGTGGTILGDIHLDNLETWIDDPRATGTSNGIDLFTVLLHELGHALGLGHSLNSDSVMYATYTGAHRTLSADDIAGITYLYGPQPLSSGAQIASVPEPGTLTLLGLGLAGLAAGVRRRAKATKGEQG